MDSRREDWFGKDEYDAIENGCDVIIDEDIESVRRPSLYPRMVDFLNDELYDKMQEILKHSKRRPAFKYGETGAIIRADARMAFIPIDGTYDRVDLIGSELFNALVDENGHYCVGFGCIICVHNHPNNEWFSYSDLLRFLRYTSISAIAIVGNTHNVYILQKCKSATGRYYDYSTVITRIKSKRIELLKQKESLDKTEAEITKMVSDAVLNDATKYMLKLTHYKRRKKDE